MIAFGVLLLILLMSLLASCRGADTRESREWQPVPLNVSPQRRATSRL